MTQEGQKSEPPPSLTTEGKGKGTAKAATTKAADEKASQKKEKKAPPAGLVIPPKNPKLSKAERRKIQEEQRAAKGLKGDGTQRAAKGLKGDGTLASQKKGVDKQHADMKAAGSRTNNGNGVTSSDDKNKTLNFFSHLPPYKGHSTTKKELSGVSLGKSKNKTSTLHPAVLSLGLQFTTGTIRGANARAKAMLRTFKIAIQDYTPIQSKRQDVRDDLHQNLLKPVFNYFSNTCRTHSVTMGNAFTFLKKFVLDTEREIQLENLKDITCDAIDSYIEERICFADKAISEYACTKIVNGDVILTYAKSEVVEKLLQDAYRKEKKQFRVILVDSRPLLEGREMLEVLIKAGIECSYIFLNSVSYVMKEVTKVFLGAAALMSDGSVLSRVGTASVALMAQSNNVPVLFCCETHKISNRVQLESVTNNELGNSDDLISTQCALDRTGGTGFLKEDCSKNEVLKHWREVPSLRLLNLLYDLTPSTFVSGIVTEMGILPPTSVAVLLREMNPQDNESTSFKSADILC